MGGQAHQAIGPHDCARLGHRHVVLAHVHSVGIRLDRQIGPIVEDEQRVVLLARSGETPSRGDDVLLSGVFHPEL